MRSAIAGPGVMRNLRGTKLFFVLTHLLVEGAANELAVALAHLRRSLLQKAHGCYTSNRS